MHYKNGRLARVGDPVIGTTYNRPGPQVGILVGITPANETCNCRVALAKRVVPTEAIANGTMGLLHSENTIITLVSLEIDYTACKDLVHAGDALVLVDGAELAKATETLATSS